MGVVALLSRYIGRFIFISIIKHYKDMQSFYLKSFKTRANNQIKVIICNIWI